MLIQLEAIQVSIQLEAIQVLIQLDGIQVLKEQSRPSVSNVTSANITLATTQSRERYWLTSQNPSVNGTDWSTEIIQ